MTTLADCLAGAAAAVVLLSGCGVGACGPDECPQAVDGRTLLQPAVAGLETYHAREGVYPADLSGLVPIDLDALPPRPEWAPTTTGATEWWTFEPDSSGYALSFQYYGPGANTCTATDKEPWSCSGYY